MGVVLDVLSGVFSSQLRPTDSWSQYLELGTCREPVVPSRATSDQRTRVYTYVTVVTQQLWCVESE